MWKAIERLQQGESLNIQDPEWSRFVTIVKEQHKLDEVSYHKFFNILKQYQKEVSELRAERLARNANPLTLVATAQANQDPYYQTSKSHKSYAPSSKPLILTRSHTTTKYKGKEIAKLITPPSETSSNSRNKNVDTTPRYKNDNQSGQFGNQRTMNVAGARENVDTNEEIDEQELEAYYSYMAKIQENDQNDVECDDERVALANLIANLKLDVDENKKIQTQLKKENTTLAQELKECKTILAKTSKTLGESNRVRHSHLVALQNKQTEFEKYKAFNNYTISYGKLDCKLNETLGQLAHLDIEIKEGLVKQKTKVITNLKLKEEHNIDKMLSLEKQLKFLNEFVYKQNQSIQTIHMMAPKVPTYNGRPTFANPRYVKQAQSKIPCLYAFPYDKSTYANRLIPDGEETLTIERESRSKLNKDSVRPYDYTTLNSLYEIFKPPTQELEIQLAHANETRRKMWRKSFVKYKPNIFKNIGSLPVSKSISKIRQAYNVMTNNINHFKEIVDNAWVKHKKDQFRAPNAKDMKILIQTCLMPLALKTHNDSFIFVHELKQEMHADLKYVESLEKEIDELMI
nr:hypothetical protein [Tanacetum cinerariifolium]